MLLSRQLSISPNSSNRTSMSRATAIISQSESEGDCIGSIVAIRFVVWTVRRLYTGGVEAFYFSPASCSAFHHRHIAFWLDRCGCGDGGDWEALENETKMTLRFSPIFFKTNESHWNEECLPRRRRRRRRMRMIRLIGVRNIFLSTVFGAASQSQFVPTYFRQSRPNNSTWETENISPKFN